MRILLFLLAVVVLLRAPMGSLVEAQTKKEPTGVIEIGEGKDEKFRFFVRDSEGKLVAMSSPGGFASVKDAEAEIERLRAIVAKAKVTVLKKESKDAAPKDKGKDAE